MKRIRLLGGIFLAFVLILLAIPYIVSAEQFRPLIQSQLQSTLGRPVEFGALSLRLFPLGLNAANLNVKGLATADEISVRARLFPLLQGDIEIDSLVLTRPVVTYDTRAAKSANKSASPGIPALGSVRIIDGRLNLTNAQGERSEYDNIDADIQTTASAASGTVSWKNGTLPVNLTFAAANNQNVWDVSRLDAAMGDVTATFTGKIDANASTVDGTLNIKPSPLTGLPIKSAYRPTGTLSAAIKVTGPLKSPALNGSAQIANLEVTGGKLTQPLRATALELQLTPARISAKPFTLTVGPTVVQTAFQLANYTETPTVDATITTRDASVADLLAIAQADDISGTGVISLQVHATGALANPQLAGTGSIAKTTLRLPALQPELKIDTAKLAFEANGAAIEDAVFHIAKSNWRGAIRLQNFKSPRLAISLQADRLSNTEMQSWLPPSKGGGKPITVSGDIAVGKLELNGLTLDDVKSNISLQNQILTLDPLTAAVYGGRLAGSATVNLKAEPAVFTVNTHLEKIESGQLLAATTPLRNVVTGPLTADAQFNFSPKPGEDFARTLGGNIQLQIAEGKLLPVNLLGEIGTIAKFIKPLRAATNNTSLLGLKGGFKINNGTVETQDLRLELDQAAALVTGTFNLADQSLDLRMLTTLNKELSEQVGGTKIGGFLSAAVAGPKGELLMPSLVKGTFSKPIITPDAVAVGKLKLGQPQNIQQGVQNVLDLFKGKKTN